MTIFVDTNILLYSISDDPLVEQKQVIAEELLRERSVALSVQVLNEFVWQSTNGKRAHRISFEEAMMMVEAWSRRKVEPLDMRLFGVARGVATRTNYTWWDCLIIAAAITAGCETLATEDMRHGHVIDGVRIENPFRTIG